VFSSSGEGAKTPTHLGPLERLRLALSKGPSPEDGNRFTFRNVVFLVSRIPDDGQSPKTQ
jgi:hypothetical protein